MNICVVGLGKIGLPLAVQYATKGHRVVGSDINPNTVEQINRGVEPFPGETDLQSKLADVVRSGLLTAVTSTATAVAESEAVVVVVPLFVDNQSKPDFGWMDAATREIGLGLKRGTLVSYETTLPVGTTRNRFGPSLMELSGLTPGIDFDLIFSPERVLTGRVFEDLRRYPKLVGGVNQKSEMRGVRFYEAVLDFEPRQDLGRPNGVWEMGSVEAAELAKLAETTYRDVNIGLANQFACFADRHNIDIYAVIEACNSQPFSHIHKPGIAVGGHCIPVYPRLYLHNDPDASVVRAAREVNASMPDYAVRLLQRVIGGLSGMHVVILGAAYRGGVKETAFSGVFPLVSALKEAGAVVSIHDPMYSDDEIRAFGWQPFKLGEEADAAILQADHVEYTSLKPSQFPNIRCMVDGRNVLDSAAWSKVPTLRIGQIVSADWSE